MSADSKHRIEPGGKFYRQASPYDTTTRSPRYDFEVLAVDNSARYKVIDNSKIMGPPGRHFWVGDISNESHAPVFITLSKDGDPFDPAS